MLKIFSKDNFPLKHIEAHLANKCSWESLHDVVVMEGVVHFTIEEKPEEINPNLR